MHNTNIFKATIQTNSYLPKGAVQISGGIRPMSDPDLPTWDSSGVSIGPIPSLGVRFDPFSAKTGSLYCIIVYSFRFGSNLPPSNLVI